jgi:hypothetical protein
MMGISRSVRHLHQTCEEQPAHHVINYCTTPYNPVMMSDTRDDKEATMVAASHSQPPPAAVILTNAQEAAVEESQMTLRQGLRLSPKAVFWSLAMSTCIVMEGYDTFLLNNLYGQPAFRKQFGMLISADTYEVPAQWQAGLGNGSSCGQLIGLLLGGFCSERFGFHRTAVGSLAVTTGLIFMQFFAPNLPTLLAGIVLFGESGPVAYYILFPRCPENHDEFY